METLPRGIRSRVERSWRSVPIVVLEGLRGVGKTTIAKDLVSPNRYFSLADEDTLRRAREDLRGWMESLPLGSAIDEAQLVPNLSLEAKSIVDSNSGHPGQFLLTGSSRISRTELGGSDPLVGRVLRMRVEPFSQCELAGHPRDSVAALFNDDPREWEVEPIRHVDLAERFARGGLPPIWKSEELSEELEVRKGQISQYSEGLFSGDIYATGRKQAGILRLFDYVCATSSHLENFANFQSNVGVAIGTAHGYLAALMDVFLVESVPGYRASAEKRITDKRRLYVADPAFVAQAINLAEGTALLDKEVGMFTETIVVTELRRLIGWTSVQLRSPDPISHWRMGDKYEVDVVLERADGKVIAIEVKAGRSLKSNFTNGIEAFRKEYADDFHRGFVIHSGDHVAQLGDNIWAIPYSALWTIGPEVAVLPSGLSISERLKRAHERSVAAKAAEQGTVLTQQRFEESIAENAAAKFALAGPLFDELVTALADLTPNPTLGEVSESNPEPGSSVLWSAQRQLRFAPRSDATAVFLLWLQARVLKAKPDVIDWLLTFSPARSDVSNLCEFRGKTSRFEDPSRVLEELFGKCADELPSEFFKLGLI